MDEKGRKILIGVLVVVAVAVGIYFYIATSGTPVAAVPKKMLPSDWPAPTPEEKAQLATSKGAQVLVSYTERGFEPVKVTIKKGDTIRFANNSSGDLWVSAGGSVGSVYPGTGKECGQSAFDSCRILRPLHFWEFTFDIAGTWGYKNVSDTAMMGVVIVQ